jgi:hypothetical protein
MCTGNSITNCPITDSNCPKTDADRRHSDTVSCADSISAYQYISGQDTSKSAYQERRGGRQGAEGQGGRGARAAYQDIRASLGRISDQPTPPRRIRLRRPSQGTRDTERAGARRAGERNIPPVIVIVVVLGRSQHCACAPYVAQGGEHKQECRSYIIWIATQMSLLPAAEPAIRAVPGMLAWPTQRAMPGRSRVP